mmetsp:Transcript_114876/g.336032  ORF Transcript_114876/g.336032 Transcript_114876/m.336032 type:complete len:237 (+) Transcript_114876:1449-2159(+)
MACACETRPGSPDDTAELRRAWRCDRAESSASFSSTTADSSASKAVAARAALRCIETSEAVLDVAAPPSCALPPPPSGQAGEAGGRRTFSHALARLAPTAPSSAAVIATGTTPPFLTWARSETTSPSCSLKQATRTLLCLCISRTSSRLCDSAAPAASPAPEESTASSRLSSAAETSSSRRSDARSRTTSAQAASTAEVKTARASAGVARPGRKRRQALRQSWGQSPTKPRASADR